MEAMDQSSSPADRLRAASLEHEQLVDYAARLDRLLLARRADELFATVGEITAFLRHELWGHFRNEETLIFPAALLALPSFEMTQLVLGLQRDHGALWAQAESLVGRLTLQSTAPSAIMGYAAEVKSLVDRLQQHARVELSELFPRILASPSALVLLDDLRERFPPQLHRAADG